MNPTLELEKEIQKSEINSSTEKSYFIQTYGCQMNYADSERTAGLFERMGFKQAPDMQSAEIVIFNTCSIRQKAEDKVFGAIHNLAQLRKQRPEIKIGVTGCMARKSSTRFSDEKDAILHQIKHLDFIFPIKDLAQLPHLLAEIDPKYADVESADSSTENYFRINPKNTTKFQRFLPIMSGCDKFCTYCIVPYSRGREWSRSMDEIYEEAKKMVEEGALEITLVGQNVNSYGITIADKAKSGLFDYSDLEANPPFVQLLRRVDQLKELGLKRLRFTSSNPWNFSKALVYAIRDFETLTPYVHLPLQSGSDSVLARMNRSHTREHYLEIAELLFKEIPGCVLTTDLIVGFCGETEEEFMETYELFKRMKWDMVYIAQYSQRRGTLAAKMLEDDVPREEKRRRWHMLNDLMMEICLEKNQSYVGQIHEVLVEKNENGVNKGRTPHYKEVYIHSKRDFTGQIIPVQIKRAKEWILEGEPI
jgi:tRNA-2-methylthio-N6-dimethylallyladenosine synthase